MPRGIPRAGTKSNRMTHQELYRLTVYVAAHYKESGLNDVEFAKTHEEEFGLPLTVANISSARSNINLPNNVTRVVGGKNNSKYAELERRVKVLEDRVEVYLKGSRGDKKADKSLPALVGSFSLAS